MQKSKVGAKAFKKNCVKPMDCNKKGRCPCNAFIRCSGRKPYGERIWSNPGKKAEALRGFAYDGAGPAANQDYYQQQFKYRLNSSMKNPASKANHFFKGIQSLADPSKMVLTMPEITDAYVDANMAILMNELQNAAFFTDFLRSMVARSNMVENGLMLKSDIYLDNKGRILFDKQQAVPFSYHFKPDEWTVDHILPKSKGGCNRFCNAAVLVREDNCYDKNDAGASCPCVSIVEKESDKVDNQKPFEHRGANKYPELYECSTLQLNKNNNVKKLPDKPPGTMKKYRNICNLDDPRHHIVGRGKAVAKRTRKICN